ncbi:MAG: hypothetical protein ACUVX8_07930 [Candidatus Zipacnadales bacterium]
MATLSFVGVGGIMLLVLPPLGILCVLLTGPLALFIGRRQHEEEQVAVAPLLVAVVALALEMVLAGALSFQVRFRDSIPLPLGSRGPVFMLSEYTAGNVFALAVALLTTLIVVGAAHSALKSISTAELMTTLAVWATQVGLIMAGELSTVIWAISFTNIAAGAMLLVVWRQAPNRALWLWGTALGVPLLTLLLLLPFRTITLGSDLIDARTALRGLDGPLVHSLLARLWLAAMLGPIFDMAAFIATREKCRQASLSLAVLTIVQLMGILPALFRITATGFPSDSPWLSQQWLTTRLTTFAVGLGVFVLVFAQLKLRLLQRLCLLSIGAICSVAIGIAAFHGTAGVGALVHASVAGLALPYCFFAVAALESVDRAPQKAPSYLPVAFTAVLPVLASLAVSWLWVARIRGMSGPTAAGLLLALLLAAAGVRLAVQLTRARREALSNGFFPRFAGQSWLLQALALAPWAISLAVVVICWAPTARSFSPPLP